MKLFARLFNKAVVAPPTLDERIAALNTASEEFVLGIARSAVEQEPLRVAAIHRLSYGNGLRQIAGLDEWPELSDAGQSESLQRAAQSRVAELIDRGTLDFAAFCAQTQSRSVTFAVAALSKDPTRLAQALASIASPEHVAELVTQAPSSQLRQLAAASITDPTVLRELLKQVRNKDKSVYKILKQKCDALNAVEREALAAAEQAAGLCASLERHARRAYDADYVTTFEQLRGSWRSLASRPVPQLEERALQAMDLCGEVVAAHLRAVAQQAAQQSIQEAERRAARDAAAQALELTRLAASANADAVARERAEMATKLRAEEAIRAQQRAVEELALRQLGGLVRQAQSALHEGSTQRAAGLRRAIEDKLPSSPVLPTHLTRQLQQLDHSLQELRQWKDYAVAPKRAALIEEMEALVGSSEEPQRLAGHIKSLQQEWRTISKGIVSEAATEWERFHRAAEAAYQPCRAYFEQQATQRRENLESRKAILARLAEFDASQLPQAMDWRLTSSVLREAPQEWRQYFPVDRDANRGIQAEFDAALGRLQAKLASWYAQNVAEKQALIERARQALALEDGRESIETVKRLQLLWKDTSPAPRERDRALWSEFRELCDAAFQRRQQANAEYSASLEASRTAALALCEEIERVATSSGAALIEGNARIAEWRVAYEALGEMPRAEARDLQDRFERAVATCSSELSRQRLLAAEQSFTDLREAGRLVHRYQWSVANAAPTAERDAAKADAETFVAAVPHWPKGGLAAVTEALGQAESVSSTEVAQRETALRMLCIRCEIQIGASTPAEDEQLRRQYQVQRLTRGMGQGSHADDVSWSSSEWDAAVLEWIRIGAVEPSTEEVLTQRFWQSRQARPIATATLVNFDYPEERGERRDTHDKRSGRSAREGREGTKMSNAR